jgi:hypothetical protein
MMDRLESFNAYHAVSRQIKYCKLTIICTYSMEANGHEEE